MFSTSEVVTLGLIVLLAIVVGLIGYEKYSLSREDPHARERARRAVLVAYGKMGDATVLDLRDELLIYTYAVRGVEYTASQDVSRLKEHLPTDWHVLGGHALVRYDARNPANSIVLAEKWSGLRANQPGA